MSTSVKIILFVIFTPIAGFFLYLVNIAESGCPLIGRGAGHGLCGGSGGDIWMLPFFVAPIGIPAVIIVLFLIVQVAIKMVWVKAKEIHEVMK